MSAEDLFFELIDSGIVFSIKNDDLKIKAEKGQLTQSLISIIRENKAEFKELVKLYKSDNNNSAIIASLIEKRYYVASSVQNRMHLLQGMNRESTFYNVPSITVWNSDIDESMLENAFRLIVERHEILRTSFVEEDGTLYQLIHDEVDFIVERYECGKGEEGEIINGFIRPFNLDEAPLIRAGVIRLDSNEYIVMSDIHHIATDMISAGIFTKELMDLYYGRELEPVVLQYRDYSEWVDSTERREEINRQEEFWLEEYRDEAPELVLPLDYPRPVVQSFEGGIYSFELGEEESESLRALAGEKQITMFMLVFSVVNIYLSKLNNSDDVVVGIPVNGRSHPDLDSIFGMFVNTLAVRIKIDGEKSFTDYLDYVKEKILGVFENQDYPFNELVEKVCKNRDMSRNPLFDVMFSYQSGVTRGSSGEDGDLKVSRYNGDQDHTISKFDLSISCSDFGENINFSFEYCIRLFKEETITRFSSYLKELVKNLLSEPENQIKVIEILPSEEKLKILNDFSGIQADYPRNKTIHQLFEEQVERTPDNIAAVFDDVELTYRELNRRANCVAAHLIGRGVQVETIIGIMLPRSIEMVIGVFSILKLGGTYLPIDPDYPGDRIEFMLSDSKAEVLFTLRGVNISDDVKKERTIIYLDDKIYYRKNEKNPLLEYNSGKLAYIIYTSGSTGQPKGVLISHRNVINTIYDINNRFKISEKDICFSISSLCFDLSVYDIFGLLFVGGTIVIPNSKFINDPKMWISYLIKYKITIWNSVPVFMQMLVEYDINKKTYLRNVLLSGDWIPLTLPDKIKSQFRDVDVISLGGATEASIWSIYYPIKQIQSSWRSIPYGKPLNNQYFYILDSDLKVCPIGGIGELYIGGEGVALEYLNRPKLSKNKFIGNPFVSYDIIYKTEDLGRWLPDGNIEFLGRIDDQVKIRGFRIELDEIKIKFLEYAKMKDAEIISKEDNNGDKYLCAYFIAEVELDEKELRKYLSTKLPLYMIPTYFIKLEKFPLTSNGKIDRKNLPEPHFEKKSLFVEPRNELDLIIVDIWSDVLNIEADKISIDDSFFLLGGHSLKIVQLIAKMNISFNNNFLVSDIFKYSTVRELSDSINNELSKKWSALVSLSINNINKNIYLIPAAATNITSFSSLVNSLDKSSNIYGLQYYNLAAEKVEENSIEEIAAANIRELIGNNLTNPSCLIGHSFGGYIALEMALQLENKGYKVDNVILLDCFAPNIGNFDDFELEKEILSHQVIEALLEAYSLEIDMNMSDSSNLTLNEIYNMILKRNGKLFFTDFAEFRRIYETYIVQGNSIKYYHPECNNPSFPVTLLKASDNTYRDKYLGWDKIINSQLNVKIVEGDHFSILKNPNVERLSDSIKNILNTAKEKQVQLLGFKI